MSRPALQRQSAARLQERRSSRAVDLRVDLRVAGTDEHLLAAGGRWDPRAFAFSGPGARARILRVHPGQVEASRWWARWFAAFMAGGPRSGDLDAWTALGHGGRRGGKTTLFGFFAAQFAASVVGSNVWTVSPTERRAFELRRLFNAILPQPDWCRWREKDSCYEFLHGGRLWVLSGYDPEALKAGEAHLVMLNEGQLLPKKAYLQSRGAIADKGGLVLVAANPPDKPIGRWVAELHRDCLAGRRKAKAFHFDPRLNTEIVYQALRDLEHEMSTREYRREVLGEFLPIGDVVFYQFSETLHVRPTPKLGDVTRAFTQRHFGRPFDVIVGCDFQRTPHMAATIRKAFVNPDDPSGDPLLWTIDEVIVELGDEDALISALEAKGYRGGTSAVVADASGEWQDADRTKGRGSFDVFRRRGWIYIFPPDPDTKKNPDIVERCKVGNARLQTTDGKVHEYIDPGCTFLIQALGGWEMRAGVPYRRSIYAHACDAWNYPQWRFYPRKAPPAPVEYTAVPRTKGRRADELDGL